MSDRNSQITTVLRDEHPAGAAVGLDASRFSERYENVKVYGRGHGVRAGVVTPEPTSPEERGWTPHEFLGGVFEHNAFPDHAVMDRGEGRDWLVLQRCKRRPNLSRLLEVAQDALGEGMMLGKLSVFPRALRVLLTEASAGRIGLPSVPIRCRRLGEPRHVTVLGIDVELRLTVTNAPPRQPQYCAEAFVGRHETSAGEPRSKLFLADLRHILQAVDPAWLVKFSTGMLLELFTWIDDLASVGLVASGKGTGVFPIFATMHHVAERDDAVFELILPGIGGIERFMSHWSGWSTPVRSLSDVRTVLRLIADDPDSFRDGGVGPTELVAAQRSPPQTKTAGVP